FRELEALASSPQNTLAARVGQMRCQRELGRPTEASAAAERVAANSSATADLRAEAGLIIAKGLLDKGDDEGAYERFKTVAAASVNHLGAEAKYHQAYVRHLQGRFRDAEKE